MCSLVNEQGDTPSFGGDLKVQPKQRGHGGMGRGGKETGVSPAVRGVLRHLAVPQGTPGWRGSVNHCHGGCHSEDGARRWLE